ncbi:MAG: LysR family transcriptional regulator [Rhodospirillaceae bacterium]|jgi:LysR family nitrogen assimilation transcriptional regulator|nr:LysR family transcriptional regulator [Rhodospirillaceae bacterium]MBT3930478.1 LysR family transcriptional regulator [Rhodospirillaceae bacterium]MBT4771247.1 LysR family transcriptional regulator [Rhodospirillaceae bacterium]MBT5357091.1 LysR family transcriptional regulator [Rhodospirillaceae bacterium]MBT5769208.1 LysR family transcriptional regulator [Rhodospirillaceae bacterium]
METRVLQNFLRVAQAGKLGQAAAEMNIAQPALSRQIALLEADVGAQLFVRHRRGVTLTEAGLLFRDHTRAILAALEQARAEVSATAQDPTGTVTLGLPTSMFYVLSADAVAEYRARYPNVFLRVHEAVGHVIESLFHDGQLDAAILIEPGTMPGVALTPLVAEDICLVGPYEAGLSLDTPVSPQHLASVPMIMLDAANHVRRRIESLLGQLGLSLNPAMEMEGQPLTFEMVRRGLGHTVLPRSAAHREIATGRMSAAPIAGATLGWSLAVSRTRADAPEVRALTELLHELAQTRIDEGAWQQSAAQ